MRKIIGVAVAVPSMSDRIASHSGADQNLEQIKKFVFKGKRSQDSADTEEIEILIPEKAQASYHCYTWPSAPILAWFLWERRSELIGKHVLELGAGTALPGILAAKCGASVTLTECATLPRALDHVKRCVEVNNLPPGQVRITGVTWGLFLSSTFSLGSIDLIIGSDCFYDPSVFEDIIVTVAYLLENNPQARFISVYQERSADWSIEHLLNKWGLSCEHLPTNNLGVESGIDINELMKDHTIHLLEITKKFGDLELSTVVFDKNTGFSRGFGFISYTSQIGFEAALNTKRHIIDGQLLRLAVSDKRQ